MDVWWCGYITTKTDVTFASTSNALPDDGVTSPTHVGAVLMLILGKF